jgi:hypothetical protein
LSDPAAADFGVTLSEPAPGRAPGALDETIALLADGRLRLRVHQTMPMQQAAEAHRQLEAAPSTSASSSPSTSAGGTNKAERNTRSEGRPMARGLLQARHREPPDLAHRRQGVLASPDGQPLGPVRRPIPGVPGDRLPVTPGQSADQGTDEPCGYRRNGPGTPGAQ